MKGRTTIRRFVEPGTIVTVAGVERTVTETNWVRVNEVLFRTKPKEIENQ